MSDLTYDLTRDLPSYLDRIGNVSSAVLDALPSSAMHNRSDSVVFPTCTVVERRSVRSDVKLIMTAPDQALQHGYVPGTP